MTCTVVGMTTLIGRLAEHLRHNGPVILVHGAKAGFAVSSEWGQEAPDSPMVAAAAYGLDENLTVALDHMLTEAGHPAVFEQPTHADRLTTIAARLESRAGVTAIPEVGRLAIDELRHIAAELDGRPTSPA